MGRAGGSQTDELQINQLTAHSSKETVVTLANNQGTISYGGKNTYTVDHGKIAATRDDIRQTDNANSSGKTETETDGGSDSDDYDGTSDLDIEITGTIAPGVTITLKQTLHDAYHGNQHDQYTDTSPIHGTDTGHLTFGMDSHDVITGAGKIEIYKVSDVPLPSCSVM